MNKLLSGILAVAVGFCLAACGEVTPRAHQEQPSVPPEVESIIEPLDAQEPSEDSLEESGEASQNIIQSEAAQSAGASQEKEAPPQTDPEPERTTEESESGESAVEYDPSLLLQETPILKAGVPEPSAEILPEATSENKLDSLKIERELLRLINEERQSVDVEALGIEDSMLFAARIRAGEALVNFSHTRPDGTPYNTAFDEAGFSYAGKWHGENLSSLNFTPGMFTEESAALEMFSGLKNSPGHYRNMVSENFLQAGIGVAISYDDGMVSMASAQLYSSL